MSVSIAQSAHEQILTCSLEGVGVLLGTFSESSNDIFVLGTYILANESSPQQEVTTARHFLPAGVEIVGVLETSAHDDFDPSTAQSKVAVWRSYWSTKLPGCNAEEKPFLLAKSSSSNARKISWFLYSYRHSSPSVVDISPIFITLDRVVASHYLLRLSLDCSLFLDLRACPDQTYETCVKGEVQSVATRLLSNDVLFKINGQLCSSDDKNGSDDIASLFGDEDPRHLFHAYNAREKWETCQHSVTFLVAPANVFDPTDSLPSTVSGRFTRTPNNQETFMNVNVPLDVLVLVQCGQSLMKTIALLQSAMVRQLKFISCDWKSQKELIPPQHCIFENLTCPLTILPASSSVDRAIQGKYHAIYSRFLEYSVNANRRRTLRCHPPMRNAIGQLYNIHRYVKPPEKEMTCRTSMVDGDYLYYHYNQQMKDQGWGCAYRSLQTICSYLIEESLVEGTVPSHTQIQQALVDVGDKPTSFVGSRHWIGSFELSLCLDHLFQVTSKIVHCPTGAEISSNTGLLAAHFQSEGTPVMIGGGVLAHTIIGVSVDEFSNVQLLILDPHYTGNDDNGDAIVNKGWCAWKKPEEFFDQSVAYNMLLPQRPRDKLI